jgi:hypothetical protein
MPHMRLFIISGVAALILAGIGALVVSGARAGPDQKDNGGSGAIYSKLGF